MSYLKLSFKGSSKKSINQFFALAYSLKCLSVQTPLEFVKLLKPQMQTLVCASETSFALAKQAERSEF